MPIIDPKYIDPSVTPYGKCPTCETLIKLKIENNTVSITEKTCPACKIDIYEEEILESFIKTFFHTQAISSANSILGLDLAIPVFLVVSVFSAFSGYAPTPSVYFFSAAFFLPVFICFRWLWKFGRFNFIDSEFIESKKKVSLSLVLWMSVCVFNFLLLIYRSID